MGLLFQLKQFFKPFPEPGSWAYNRQMVDYDKQVGEPVTGNFSLEPLEEAGENDDDDHDETVPLDDSTDIPSSRFDEFGEPFDDESIINCRNRPSECDD